MTNEEMKEIGRKIGNAVNPEQEAIKLLAGLASAVPAGPRCPKCGYGGKFLKDRPIPCNRTSVDCDNCGASTVVHNNLADFAQFFAPSPATPEPPHGYGPGFCKEHGAKLELKNGVNVCPECERGVEKFVGFPATGQPPQERTITLTALWHLLFPEGTHSADFTHNDVGEWLDAYTEEVERYTKRLAAAVPAPEGPLPSSESEVMPTAIPRRSLAGADSEASLKTSGLAEPVALEEVAREIAEMIANDVCNLVPRRIDYFMPKILAILRRLGAGEPKGAKQ